MFVQEDTIEKIKHIWPICLTRKAQVRTPVGVILEVTETVHQRDLAHTPDSLSMGDQSDSYCGSLGIGTK